MSDEAGHSSTGRVHELICTAMPARYQRAELCHPQLNVKEVVMKGSRLIATLAIAIVLAATSQAFPSAGVAGNSRSMLALTKAVAKQVAVETARLDWTVDSLAIAPKETTASANALSIVFQVTMMKRLHLANAMASALIRGQEAFLRDHGSSLTAVERSLVDQEMATWKSQIQGYIDTSSKAVQLIRATAIKGFGDTVLPETIVLDYQDAVGNYSSFPKAIASIPDDAAVQTGAYKGLARLVQNARRLGSVSVPAAATTNKYGWSAAIAYATKYSSNPNNMPCKAGSSTMQDPSKYNTAKYAKWYVCNDCANFVSQALSAGAVPQSATWKPYTTAWVNAGSLQSYMDGQDFWSTTTSAAASPGDTITFKSFSHTMMVIANDGKTRTISAHTRDRSNFVDLNPVSDEVFWDVHVYVLPL